MLITAAVSKQWAYNHESNMVGVADLEGAYSEAISTSDNRKF